METKTIPKEKLTEIRGFTTPDHITLKISRKDIKLFPKTFYLDFTIDDIRDATKRDDKYSKRGR